MTTSTAKATTRPTQKSNPRAYTSTKSTKTLNANETSSGEDFGQGTDESGQKKLRKNKI